jgi:hypothetical protein
VDYLDKPPRSSLGATRRVTGNVGSPRRKEFTATGDTVPVLTLLKAA